MLEFKLIWVFWVLPLPWLVRYLTKPAANSNQAALKVPHVEDFEFVQTTKPKIQGSTLSHILATMGWVLLITAAARPQWLGEPIELPVSGRDLMMAVDLSGSMEVEDFVLNGRRVDRLTATKAVAGEFIERRVGDRIGLILFGKNAYLQTPLTFDRETVRTLLYESVIGLAGKETAIGDAIGLAAKRLMQTDVLASKQPDENSKIESNRILILLTDGANTAGEIKPKKAAELAAAVNLKIYTIGIGADELLVPSFFGSRKVNPSMDLDEDTLRNIAEVTGGKYFRARDVNELQKIYEIIDSLEPIERDQINFRPQNALFYWPLAGALLMAMVIVIRVYLS